MMAQLALILWVPASFALFAVLRPAMAASVGLLGALLLLPARFSFNLQGFPDLDKDRLPVLAVFVACLTLAPARIRRPPPALLLAAFVLIGGSFLTAITNAEPVAFGAVYLPPLKIWDGVSFSGAALLDLLLPFFLGWTLYRKPRDLRDLLVLVTLAACIYSVPILWELRMSPQLHNIVYGYYPTGFQGLKRYGGFRPVVFMVSPLQTALFIATCCIASVSLWRAGETLLMRFGRSSNRSGVPMGPISIYLLALLVASKSLAAAVYGSVGASVLVFLRSRLVVPLAVGLASIVLTYPLLRTLDLFPTSLLVNAAANVNEERAQSLSFRFENEDILLRRAWEKIWFGWGSWRRNRVFDPISGRDISITDGYWVIVLGTRGILGCAATFGLLLAPVFLAARNFSALRSRRDRLVVAGVIWIVTLNAIDKIPNAHPNAFAIFVAGALAGAITGSKRVRSHSGNPKRISHGPAQPRSEERSHCALPDVGPDVRLDPSIVQASG